MHILVTDATGTVGRLVARQLIAAGHSVTGISEQSDPRLDPAVEFVCASLSDPVLQELADEADAVIHLAPVEPGVPGSAGINGVAYVTHAAGRAGARLLFVSHAAGSPQVYEPAEDLVSTGLGPSLIVRIAPPVGRQLDWMVCRTAATLLRAKVSTQPMRVLHLDDLVRFLVLALNTDRTGVVDLATPDTTNVVTAWRLLRAVDPRSRIHRIHGWSQLIPPMDIVAAQEDWLFEFGWAAFDAVADTARGLVGRRLGAAGATSHGAQMALPVEVLPRPAPSDELPSAAPEGVEGEFDDRIDPRFPVFATDGLTEALPGPLTPITLDVQVSGLHTASRVMGQALALGGVVDDEWASRAVAVFGHRPYVGVSANVVAANQLLGWDDKALVRRALVGQPQVGDVLPFGQPRLAGGALGSVAKAVATTRSLALMRHLKADTRAYSAAAKAEHWDAAQLSLLPDAGLGVRVRLLRDRIHQGWILTALWLIDSGVTAAALEYTEAATRVPGVGAIMESGRIADEIAELTAALRLDPPLRAMAQEGNLASIRALSPSTAALLDAAIAQIGHRGPGEAELASRVFSDDPALLLSAAAEFAGEPAESDPPVTLVQRIATNARVSRELAHDATLRFTHELRMTLRELGSRRVAADLIDVVDDVYYLTCDELVTMPADARLRIKRRRAERERLQAQRPPEVIDHDWVPVDPPSVQEIAEG
ncbi:NAD-dependent epimerase/dehydratase family protein [Mycobacterium sp. Aquia_216]|uniref:NAD-dependent epimerase/dehydratase family protein n=1 Tax=Mycobacterium sp. Aquia_216 TaxID=2991729 RepID=UPI00227AF581|nr:NAD-dependent epimerase/dehydratase family protein [Mycobacterium sp. Aquia_216]WAJ42686.1 NAD-dependent epimerase/dehydratase family protein [Mycobacterium sp. Aquia_216]